MEKRLHCSMVVFFVMLLVLAANASGGETIRLTNGEWPPYLSKDLKYHGSASRIITEAFAREGVEVEYGFFPWKRAYSLAKQGRWDGSVVWIRTPDREKDFHYGPAVVEQVKAFYYLKAEPFDWNTFADLKGIPIGGTIGYTYGKAFAEAEKAGEIKVERVPTDEINFRKLFKGRIRLFPIEPDIARELLKKSFSAGEIEKLAFHPKPLTLETYHLILSKKYKQAGRMLELFDKGMKHLRESGKADRYFGESMRGEYRK